MMETKPTWTHGKTFLASFKIIKNINERKKMKMDVRFKNYNCNAIIMRITICMFESVNIF